MRYSQPYHGAVAIQRVVLAEATADDKPEAKTLAALARAYVDLEMLKLRLRMKPAPKPVDVSAAQGKRVRVVKESFQESPSSQTVPAPSTPGTLPDSASVDNRTPV